MNKIGKNIVVIREALNLNRRDLSKKSGVLYKTLSRIEKGSVKEDDIRLGTLKKIVKALNISLDRLALNQKKGKIYKVDMPAEIYSLLKDKDVSTFFGTMSELDIKGIAKIKKFSKFIKSLADTSK
jgi:transcriptional regulator with XRE-family HTH domain